MKLNSINRRKFLLTALLAAPMAAVADACWVEPNWLKVSHVSLTNRKATHQLVQFSDVHHKGDRKYLQDVVSTINAIGPDFTCFTGDLIEEAKFLPEALDILSGIRSPLFGVPGNHDYWSRVSFAPIRECFAATGGAWLMDESRDVDGGQISIIGLACRYPPGYWGERIPPSNSRAKNILLLHYPAHVKQLHGRTFDLILAGHSHGGQVRLPLVGPLIVPPGVDEYDLGDFQTPAGPLHVNAGIGYIDDYNFRFNCRPEITVIEI